MGNESIFVYEFKNRWDKFRDALRREVHLILDEMFKAPEIHRDDVDAMEGNDFEKMAMAMMIEKRKLDNKIAGELDSLQRRFAVPEKNLKQDN